MTDASSQQTSDAGSADPEHVGMYFSRRALPIHKGPRRPAPLPTHRQPGRLVQDGDSSDDEDVRSASVLSSTLPPSRLSYDSRRSSDSFSSQRGPAGRLKRMLARGVPLAAPHADFAEADNDAGAGAKEYTQDLRTSDLSKQKSRKVGLGHKLAAKAVRKMVNPKKKYDKPKTLIDSRFQYLAYLLATIWYLLCIYFCLIIGISFNREVADAWILGFCISVFQVDPPLPASALPLYFLADVGIYAVTLLVTFFVICA